MNIRVFKILRDVAEVIEPVSKARMAAAIVYKNTIISIGVNKYKSDPLQLRFNKKEGKIYLHAEISAIKKASKELTDYQFKKSDIYVYRLRTSNTAGISYPCNGCLNAIYEFRLKNINFINEKGEFDSIKLNY